MNSSIFAVTDDLKALVLSLQARVDTLEGGAPAKPAAKAAPAPAADDDDDDVDLFGSDEEEDDEEKKRITEERLKAYHEKKSKKAAVIAKTSVLLDVKVASIITPDLLFKHIIARSLGTMRLTWTRCSRA